MKLYTVQEREISLKAELDRIVEVLIAEYRPEKIVLFGSLADDAVHEWSDIDLLIVKETDKRPIERNIEPFNLIHPDPSEGRDRPVHLYTAGVRAPS